MGLFSFSSKPGPGVSKDAPEKNRFFLFFELFFRKFFKLLKLNLMYVVSLIPLLLGLYLSININPAIVEDVTNFSKMPLFVFSGDIIGLILILVSIFITGPSTAGFTYVIRNFQRQEHAWVFSDYIEHFKKNYKQGVAMSLIDIVGYFMLYVALMFYVFSPSDAIAQMAPFLAAVIALLIITFMFMHYYIYTMMVTFDLKLKDILKNALLFAYAKLPLNILITVILGILIFFSIYFTGIGILAYLLIGFSLYGYIITYSVYPSIDKLMISPFKTEDEEFVSDFEDNI